MTYLFVVVISSEGVVVGHPDRSRASRGRRVSRRYCIFYCYVVMIYIIISVIAIGRRGYYYYCYNYYYYCVCKRWTATIITQLWRRRRARPPDGVPTNTLYYYVRAKRRKKKPPCDANCTRPTRLILGVPFRAGRRDVIIARAFYAQTHSVTAAAGAVRVTQFFRL